MIRNPENDMFFFSAAGKVPSGRCSAAETTRSSRPRTNAFKGEEVLLQEAAFSSWYVAQKTASKGKPRVSEFSLYYVTLLREHLLLSYP